MDVFDLAAKIRLDTSEYSKGLSDAEKETNSFASKLGSGLASVGKAVGAAVVGAATALGTGSVAMVKQATDSYAQYEQLVGGVETLFQSSSDTILEYANKAYATAGLSANQYMETVTSFAASLVQSTGRSAYQDTEELEAQLEAQYKATKRTLNDEYDAVKASWDKRVKAAKTSSEKDVLREQRDAELKALKQSNEDKLAEMEAYNKQYIKEVETANYASVTTEESLERAAKLANMAIIDMSDNANKMGTSMQSIQNAYQGFAKQNYTMLDNLKLGYGGTKTEMERLLKDAEKISGIQYNVGSYADIVEAIHLIQTQMGISGLTAEDAAKMVESGALTEEEAYKNLGTTAKEAAGTIEGSAKAVRASWNNIIAGLANGNADIENLIDIFLTNVETSVDNLLPTIERAVNGVIKLAGSFIEKAPTLVQKFLPSIKNAITTLFTSITNALPQFLSVASNLVKYIADVLINNAPALIVAARDIIITLANGIGTALPQLIPTVVQVIVDIVKTLTDPESISAIVNAAIVLITGLLNGILDAIPILLEAAPVIIENLVTAIVDNLPKIIEAAVEIIATIIGYLNDPETILMLIECGIKITIAVLKGVYSLISKIPELVTKIVTKIIEQFGKFNDKMKNSGKEIVQKFADGVVNAAKDAVNWGKDLISNFLSGIKEKWSALKDTVSNVAKSIKDFLGFSEPDKGPLSNFHTYAPDMMKLFAEGIRKNEYLVTDQIAKSFNFDDVGIGGNIGYGGLSAARRESGNVTVILELDKQQFARTVFKLNKEEQQRMGVSLVNV